MVSNVINMIELIHFQLTRNCNLRCYFCGQWGKKGFFSSASGIAMTEKDWFRVLDELEKLFRDEEKKPGIILWGGEPLCSPYFDEITRALHQAGFQLGMITNGTLLSRHADVCNECLEKIYISIDGPLPIHDEIRGAGVFEQAKAGRRLLKDVEVVLMSVITEKTQDHIQELVDAFKEFEPNELILQQQIGLTEKEIKAYEKWMKEEFQQDVPYIKSWLHDKEKEGWLEKQRKNVQKQLQNIIAPFPVVFLPHLNQDNNKKCLSPKKHIHIAWNGDVLYCTDFYDFRAGNIRTDGLLDIYFNDRSERFRKGIIEGKCPTCSHCSWRNKGELYNI